MEWRSNQQCQTKRMKSYFLHIWRIGKMASAPVRFYLFHVYRASMDGIAGSLRIWYNSKFEGWQFLNRAMIVNSDDKQKVTDVWSSPLSHHISPLYWSAFHFEKCFTTDKSSLPCSTEWRAVEFPPSSITEETALGTSLPKYFFTSFNRKCPPSFIEALLLWKEILCYSIVYAVMWLTLRIQQLNFTIHSIKHDFQNSYLHCLEFKVSIGGDQITEVMNWLT